FSGLVMRLLAKDPADRPQSAREVVEAIESLESAEMTEEADVCSAEVLDSPSSSATDEGSRKRDRGRPKRTRVRRREKQLEAETDWGPWVLAAGAALLIVATLVLLFVLIRHAG